MYICIYIYIYVAARPSGRPPAGSGGPRFGAQVA